MPSTHLRHSTRWCPRRHVHGHTPQRVETHVRRHVSRHVSGRAYRHAYSRVCRHAHRPRWACATKDSCASHMSTHMPAHMSTRVSTHMYVYTHLCTQLRVPSDRPRDVDELRGQEDARAGAAPRRSASASPTACPLRARRRAGAQNDRLCREPFRSGARGAMPGAAPGRVPALIFATRRAS